jgi:glycosyltransferase involved in cell wall biosynthesis
MVSETKSRLRLMVISAFHPELHHGGSQRVAFDVFRALSSSFGAVFLAAVDDKQAQKLPSAVPITSFEGRQDEFIFRAEAYDPVWQKLCSPTAVDALREFLSFQKPDIIHVHHYLFFGIDFLSIIKSTLPSVKIVLTLHDLASVCPANGCMVRTVDQSLCNEASAFRCHQCIPAFDPNHFEQRRRWFHAHLALVDIFTCPSRFLIERYIAWGLDRERVRLVTNGVAGGRPVSSSFGRQRRNRFGFFGQIIDMKGVQVLLRAVSLLRAEGFTDLIVEINGDNLAEASLELRSELESFMASEHARAREEQIVFFNGPYELEHIEGRMRRIDWALVPSIWWEAFALVISEAWSFGRPVICSDAGAMAERVSRGRDGLLFPVGDAEALAATMRRAVEEVTLWDDLVSGIKPCPRIEDMASHYADLYHELLVSTDLCVDALGE